MAVSLISKQLLAQTSRRYWPLWLAFFVAWAMGLVLPLIGLSPMASNTAAFPSFWESGWSVEFLASLAGTMFASVITVLLVFENLFSPSASSFYGALPIKRKTLFGSLFFAGLLSLLIVELVVFALVCLITLAYPNASLDACIEWLGLAVGFTVVMYATMAFCAHLTGNRGAALLAFFLVNAFVPTAEVLLREIANYMMWGVQDSSSWSLSFLSPLVGMAQHVLPGGIDFEIEKWLALLGYVVVAVVMFAATAAIHDRRNYESAGSIIAVLRVRPAFKFISAAFIAILFGFIAETVCKISGPTAGDVLVIAKIGIAMIGGSFLGSFFAEMFLSRTTRVWTGSWKGGLALSLACVAFLTASMIHGSAAQNYVPDVEEIASVTLGTSEESKVTSKENIQAVIDVHRELLEIGPDCGNDVVAYENPEVLPDSLLSISYRMKDGSEVVRRYDLPYQVESGDSRSESLLAVSRKYVSILNSEEALMSRFSPFFEAEPSRVLISVYGLGGEELNLSSGQTGSFLEALRRDIEGESKMVVSGGDVFVGAADSSTEREVKETVEVLLNLLDQNNDVTKSQCLSVCKEAMPECASWIEKELALDVR